MSIFGFRKWILFMGEAKKCFGLLIGQQVFVGVVLLLEKKLSVSKQLNPYYEKSTVLVASNLIIHIINPQLAHYPDRQ